ncbi:GntR family transcriptional regulator [Nocardia flavorosea]|uniref:GntR family transcriptional regulator n=1 Tax=Nocardia flavorosea TaxID=53429 RepID=A0A846YKJ5_9NOCA|nr:GntR family transcriptional regulator [Nocardia flavorosea]NKY58134.1 GntR family transcriptional regulator [Nocardia flavorosea]
MVIPLHARVSAELRERIHRGALPPGASLPSEARLCAEFDASRGTVRTALATLRHEGLIIGGQGRPPVVRDTASGQPFESLVSFTAWAERIGRTPGQRTVEIARRGAGAAAATALGIGEGTPVVDVLRVRSLDGEPVMLERATFVEPVGRLLFDFDPDASSIYAHLARQGVDLHSARHTIDALAADRHDATLLGIAPGAPLLRERRRTLTAAGEPVEYGDDRYRPDKVTFTIDNARPGVPGTTPDLRVRKQAE